PQQMDGRIDMEAIGKIIDRITTRVGARYRSITEGPLARSFSDGSGKMGNDILFPDQFESGHRRAREFIPGGRYSARAGEQVIEFVSRIGSENIEDPSAKSAGFGAGESATQRDGARNPITNGRRVCAPFPTAPEDHRLPCISNRNPGLERTEWLYPRAYTHVRWAHGKDGLEAWRMQRQRPAIGVFSAESL